MSAALLSEEDASTHPKPRFWDMTDSVDGNVAWVAYLDRYGYGPIENAWELQEAERLFRRNGPFFDRPPLPSGFPQPIVSLPGPMTLDIIHTGGVDLVSEKLRNALDLPPEAAQFLPIDLRTESDHVRAMRYMWLAWLRQERDIVDRERSTCLWEDVNLYGKVQTQWVNSGTGTIVVRDDFVPRFDLFEPTDWPSSKCATPALEERVRAARCEGVAFYDFATPLGQPLWISDEYGLRYQT